MEIQQVLQKLQPWQRQPVEIFFEAKNLAEKKTESGNRAAFLLLDNATESALKLYLRNRWTNEGKNPPFADDATFESWISNFEKRFTAIEWTKRTKNLRKFHGLRGGIHHDPNGLSPSINLVEEFSNEVAGFLTSLFKFELPGKDFDIDLEGLLKEGAANAAKSSILYELASVRQVAALVVERIKHELVLPSFSLRLEKIRRMPKFQDPQQMEPNEERVLELWHLIQDTIGGSLTKSYESLFEELNMKAAYEAKAILFEGASLSPKEIDDKFSRGEIDEETYQDLLIKVQENQEQAEANQDFWDFFVDDETYMHLLFIRNETQANIDPEDYRGAVEITEIKQASLSKTSEEFVSQAEEISLQMRKMKAELEDMLNSMIN